MNNKCELYELCKSSKENEIAFRISLSLQMERAIKDLSDVAENIKFNNIKHWETINELKESISQEKQDRITANGHIESKLSFERGRAIGYAALISAGIVLIGIILTNLLI